MSRPCDGHDFRPALLVALSSTPMPHRTKGKTMDELRGRAPVVGAGRGEAIFLLALVGGVLLWSAIAPNDRLTWLMEVIWVLAAIPLLVATRRRFPLTRLLYGLLAIHAVILVYGGQYTYAETPLGDWARDAFGLARNHYDRLGHFAQGFVPAILARELLLRLTPLRRGGWLFYLVCAACLSFSAFFEFIEWWAALVMGGDADAYLATQGDVWDTQWDMFLALCGSVIAQLLLARVHDRQLGLH
jgi:putative membrane protein